MTKLDDVTSYCQELLGGVYDCVDRIILNGYLASGSYGAGFRTWWRQLTGGDETFDEDHLKRMAGRSSRRVRAFALEHSLPYILREKVIRPVIAGAARPHPARPPQFIHPIDQHYDNLQREMRRTFETLNLAA